MARKTDAELRAAVQALSPSKPVVKEPQQTEEERRSSRARIAALLEKTRRGMSGHAKPQPLEHWKRVLNNPESCQLALRMAAEAIREIERRGEKEPAS